MRLQMMTWAEVEASVARDPGILMPIGSTEQHGPTGLIGTDALTAEVIAWRAGELADAVVGPTIPVGMAHHHMAFAGSMTLKPSTLIAVITEYVLSLAHHGYRRFVFVNGHGGNIPTVNAAFYEVYAALYGHGPVEGPELRCRCISWFELPGVQRLTKELFGSKEGAHATASEISVTRAAFPDTVKSAPLEPAQAPISRFFDARDYRRRHPDGRMGSDPSVASAPAGRQVIDTAAAELAAAYRQFGTLG